MAAPIPRLPPVTITIFLSCIFTALVTKSECSKILQRDIVNLCSKLLSKVFLFKKQIFLISKRNSILLSTE